MHFLVNEFGHGWLRTSIFADGKQRGGTSRRGYDESGEQLLGCSTSPEAAVVLANVGALARVGNGGGMRLITQFL